MIAPAIPLMAPVVCDVAGAGGYDAGRTSLSPPAIGVWAKDTPPPASGVMASHAAAYAPSTHSSPNFAVHPFIFYPRALSVAIRWPNWLILSPTRARSAYDLYSDH